MKRLYTPSARIRIGGHLIQESWANVLEEHDVDDNDVDDKVTELHKTVTAILDGVCPVKRVRVRSDDPG